MGWGTPKKTYQGRVSIEYGSTWALHEPGASEFQPPAHRDDFAGACVSEGAYFTSGHRETSFDVAIEIHSSSPAGPDGWGDVVQFPASFPARTAWAYGPPLERSPGREFIQDVELPAVNVVIRAAVNGRDAEFADDEQWLLQIWPDDER